MAVIVTKTANFGEGEMRLRVFLPSGKVSKAEREKAEQLDKFLAEELPKIEREMQQEGSLTGEALKKWHSLGKRLQFVDDPALVDPSDVHEHRIWLAIREYCPVSLLPKGEKEKSEEGRFSKREGKKHDHFELCYRLGKYDWENVCWIPAWTDWVDLIEAPGLVRDVRIIPEIGRHARSFDTAVLKEKFREMIKELRKEFPTKEKVIESTAFSNSVIETKVANALQRVMGSYQRN